MGKRSALILEFLEAKHAASYQELGKFFGVSTMTIRRECAELSRSGRVVKTGGGVRVNGELELYEKTTEQRMTANVIEKRAIARKALHLIARRCAIFVDGSTTCLALAKLIDAESRGLTVVTHSVDICLAIRSGRNTVISTGGELDTRSFCFVGPQAESFAKSIFVDIAFVSATGVIPTDGTFESAPAAFRVKQAVAAHADKLVLLVDHTKFGRRALCKVLDVSQIKRVITDDQTPDADVTVLRAAGIEIDIAETEKMLSGPVQSRRI